MLRMEAVYGCGDNLTPDVAARLATVAERYMARLELECGGKAVLLDSLIGILSLDCPRGTRLTVVADGAYGSGAAEAVARLLEGR